MDDSNGHPLRGKFEIRRRSLLEGITALQTNETIIYYGSVVRVPAAIARGGSVEGLAAYTPDPSEMVPTSEDIEAVLNGIVEIYEVFDPATGDLIQLWRVPCRKKQTS